MRQSARSRGGGFGREYRRGDGDDAGRDADDDAADGAAPRGETERGGDAPTGGGARGGDAKRSAAAGEVAHPRAERGAERGEEVEEVFEEEEAGVVDASRIARAAVGAEEGRRRGAGVADGEADAEARQGEGEDESEGGERGGRGGVPGDGRGGVVEEGGDVVRVVRGIDVGVRGESGRGLRHADHPRARNAAIVARVVVLAPGGRVKRRKGGGGRPAGGEVDARASIAEKGGALVLGAETTDAVGPATDPAEAPRAFGRRRHRPRKVSASALPAPHSRGRPRDQLCSGGCCGGESPAASPAAPILLTFPEMARPTRHPPAASAVCEKM